MRDLALQKRKEYDIDTRLLDLNKIRLIYKKEGIKIDLLELKGNKIKAAYFCDDNDYSVLVRQGLPREPKLFCLIHELKHHFFDQDIIKNGLVTCGDYNQNEVIEIAAEIFAAEFIYPEDEMFELINNMGISSGNCSAEIIVRFKQECPAIVSYQFITKRFERFGLCKAGQYKNTRFRKLEEELFGEPFYKQEWFKKHRAKKSKVQN